jgi:hypothetical protein
MQSDLFKRFWSKVKRGEPNECWPWLAHRDRHGYGRFTVRGRSALAHREAYALFYGHEPQGMLVCHSCDNRSCCNPDHLWAGTHGDNVRDMLAKGRQDDRRGERNPATKLTADQACAIRNAVGVKQSTLAARYGVSVSMVSLIRLGQAWAHL